MELGRPTICLYLFFTRLRAASKTLVLKTAKPDTCASPAGYLYCNMPPLLFTVGERVRFHIMTLGTEVDMHTPNMGISLTDQVSVVYFDANSSGTVHVISLLVVHPACVPAVPCLATSICTYHVHLTRSCVYLACAACTVHDQHVSAAEPTLSCIAGPSRGGRRDDARPHADGGRCHGQRGR